MSQFIAIVLSLFSAEPQCAVQPGLSYAADQLAAIDAGCPLGLAPSGHPLTEEAPFVDGLTGLPTDGAPGVDYTDMGCEQY